MSIWFLEQTHVITHPNIGNASPEIMKKVYYIVPRNLISLQEKRPMCNATLSNPINVSENVIVVTFQRVLKDYSSYIKQYLFCEHFF